MVCSPGSQRFQRFMVRGACLVTVQRCRTCVAAQAEDEWANALMLWSGRNEDKASKAAGLLNRGTNLQENNMNVLVIDVGGTHVKILATAQKERREFGSGPKLTPKRMVASVKKLAGDWKYDAVSIGYPGLVIHNRIVAEPHNLGRGWVGFDFKRAFK